MPLAAVAVALSAALAFATDVEFRGERLRLGDVADLSPLPEPIRARAAALELARIRRGAEQVRLPSSWLAAQARARMPLLGAWLPADARAATVTLHRPLRPGLPFVTSGAEGVAKGARVAVRIDAGIFHIQRDGVALADARPGERLFVLTADHQMISALCQGATP
ncbi:MAG: hypothetical protein KGN34_10025 [Sphingomonadales bacterium]|nr:hypothetical protein [Sphingomonadales bacterium]